MSEDQTEALHRVLGEFVDGYLLIGKDLDGEYIARYASADQATTNMINAMALELVRRGGLPEPKVERHHG